MVVDCSSAGLYDIDILASHRVLDLAARFSTGELGENAMAWRNAEDVAHVVYEVRMRVAREDNDVLDHIVTCKQVGRLSFKCALALNRAMSSIDAVGSRSRPKSVSFDVTRSMNKEIPGKKRDNLSCTDLWSRENPCFKMAQAGELWQDSCSPTAIRGFLHDERRAHRWLGAHGYHRAGPRHTIVPGLDRTCGVPSDPAGIEPYKRYQLPASVT